MERANSDDASRIKIITARIKAIQSGQLEDEADADDIEGLRGEADELTENISKRNKKINGYKEARMWNIDNICKVKEERSIVNKVDSASLKAEDFLPTGETGWIKTSGCTEEIFIHIFYILSYFPREKIRLEFFGNQERLQGRRRQQLSIRQLLLSLVLLLLHLECGCQHK